ncbi:HEAT repeat domain-containing protein [Streptomyces sp. NBC_01443]|uniref:HEAT repeat domain-containing protein n=1 Tax=Streptomyces sp. NBC_01443 TaxID=2903868 RepID=UPI00338FA5C0
MPYAGHADAGVRRAVARGFGTWPEAPAFLGDVREAVLALMTDMDTEVRCAACLTVAQSGDRDPAFADAMAALLDDADRRVQVTAVYGLALHDDERCVEAARRLPPAPPGTPREDELDAVWRYEWRRDGRQHRRRGRSGAPGKQGIPHGSNDAPRQLAPVRGPHKGAKRTRTTSASCPR